MLAENTWGAGSTVAPEKLQILTWTVSAEGTNMFPRMPLFRLDGHPGTSVADGITPVSAKVLDAQAPSNKAEKSIVAEPLVAGVIFAENVNAPRVTEIPEKLHTRTLAVFAALIHIIPSSPLLKVDGNPGATCAPGEAPGKEKVLSAHCPSTMVPNVRLALAEDPPPPPPPPHDPGPQ